MITAGQLRYSVAVWLIGLLYVAPGRSADDWFLPDDLRSPEAMAARVDELLEERWQTAGVQPAECSSDSEFLRRAYLDLNGVTPPVTVVREFLADTNTDKRARLIDRLLASPRYANHMANTWRQVLVPDGLSPDQAPNIVGLQDWLREQFAENLPYDAMVAEFLIADRAGSTGPGVFYTSLNLEPEKLAARTAQVFLGLQMQCAQCHDHPFDSWTQQDFWGYAAFFARVQRQGNGRARMGEYLIDTARGEVKIPDSEETVLPKYPAGRWADADEGGTRRQQLSIWMASRDNPFLPRALVNRVWAHLFGRGFIDPVDDMSPQNVASHPELLNELSEYFARSGFDIQRLIRTLVSTRAYQLSSAYDGEHPSAELFAWMPTKTLTAEQLYECMQPLLGLDGLPNGDDSMDAVTPWSDPRRQQFLLLMQGPNATPLEFDRGVPQALMLMNGADMDGATHPDQGRLLTALAAPFLTDEQRVETLYLATLTRPPTADENAKLTEYLGTQQSSHEKLAALGDIVWVLVNSAEFTLNH
ncbi:MAG: DUF1549 domain-containing protein [Planctomycetales bacterium]|nr:DUF1549 domain-containing protein [Planctomycetales bacterium]